MRKIYLNNLRQSANLPKYIKIIKAVSFLANGFSVIFSHKCKKSFNDKQKENA